MKSIPLDDLVLERSLRDHAALRETRQDALRDGPAVAFAGLRVRQCLKRHLVQALEKLPCHFELDRVGAESTPVAATSFLKTCGCGGELQDRIMGRSELRHNEPGVLTSAFPEPVQPPKLVTGKIFDTSPQLFV